MEIQNNSNWHYHIVTQSEIRAIIFYAHLNNYDIRAITICAYLKIVYI